jgi:hypothetical protein
MRGESVDRELRVIATAYEHTESPLPFTAVRRRLRKPLAEDRERPADLTPSVILLVES